jgi:hypothetical protein
MKRGLITWDKSEIPREVFDRRIDRVRAVLRQRDLSALVIYSDLWRSNQARFFSNFMPYFNRALLIIPADAPLTLLCGLSPRVYGWIRSVTTIEDVRPAGNFAKPLFEIAMERKWTAIGALEFEQFPYDLYKAIASGPLRIANVESAAAFSPAEDETEIAMRRKTGELAAQILEEEIPNAIGRIDHEFVGTLERRFRRAGVGDLLVLVTNGRSAPAPPSGVILEENFSVSVAVEYRGHWVRISRCHGATAAAIAALRAMSASQIGGFLDGTYPYEWGSGKIVARHAEFRHNGKRLFNGDTTLS